MNEIALSNDLNIITAEINSFKQVAGQAIFEIGKRLKHVKENDLVHGEFGNWLNSIEMDWNTANRFIKVSSELNSDTYHNLGSNALYLIATMPEQERTKQHEIPSTGESKTVDEMTVKELREVKKKLKEVEQDNQKLGQLLTEERNKEPETIEREIIPDDYDELKGGYEALERTSGIYKKQNEELRDELDELSNRLKQRQSTSGNKNETEKLKQEEERLKSKISEYNKLYDVQFHLEQVISIMAPKIHSLRTENIRNEHGIIDEFESTLNEVINICESAKDKIPNKNIIEGEIVNV